MTDRKRDQKHRAALSAATDYVELHARSAFSFLHGASLPEDLAAAAADAGHAVFGLADVGGVYGAPRFHTAARNAGVRPLVGRSWKSKGPARWPSSARTARATRTSAGCSPWATTAARRGSAG